MRLFEAEHWGCRSGREQQLPQVADGVHVYTGGAKGTPALDQRPSRDAAAGGHYGASRCACIFFSVQQLLLITTGESGRAHVLMTRFYCTHLFLPPCPSTPLGNNQSVQGGLSSWQGLTAPSCSNCRPPVLCAAVGLLTIMPSCPRLSVMPWYSDWYSKFIQIYNSRSYAWPIANSCMQGPDTCAAHHSMVHMGSVTGCH